MLRFLPLLAMLLLSTIPVSGDEPRALPEGVDLPEVGRAQNLRIDPDLSQATPVDGGLRWHHRLEVEKAAFLKPRFVNLNLLPGDELVVRSASGRVVERITRRGPKDAGSFWGLSAFGQVLDLELIFQRPYGHRPFLVEQVIVGDPAMLAEVTGEGDAESICAPGDFEDAFCYQGDVGKWANVLASVGVMTVGSNPVTGLWCSGSNVSPDNLVLTNFHCISDSADCSTAEFVFKFYRTGCNDGSPTTADWQSFRCDETVASSPFSNLCDANLSNLDYSLNSVIGDPASTFGYVQPDPTPITSGEAIYIVQHPAGRPHEITHGDGANVEVDGTVFRYYDTLDTEGGSSGSPIFRDSDDRMVGLHHCGGCSTPGTGNRGMLMSDIYPEIETFLCSAAVQLGAVEVSDLTEVEGNGDTLVEPGETWQFTPVLRNSACDTTALDVEAEITPNVGSTGPVDIMGGVVAFGDIAPGTSTTASAPVQFQLRGSADCAGSVILDLVDITASNGGPFDDVAAYVASEIGGVALDVVVFEDFISGIPPGWAVTNGGAGSGDAATWTTDNPGGRPLSLVPPFVIADSAEHGPGNAMDEELVSAVIDLSSYTAVELQFSHDFKTWPGDLMVGDIDMRSTATGDAWVNVARYDNADTAGVVMLDITAQAAGQSNVQVRFHYYGGDNGWWWALDDIFVNANSGATCEVFGSIFADGFESGDTSVWSSTQP